MTLIIFTIIYNDSVVLMKISHVNNIKLFVYHKGILLVSTKITEHVVTNTNHTKVTSVL